MREGQSTGKFRSEDNEGARQAKSGLRPFSLFLARVCPPLLGVLFAD